MVPLITSPVFATRDADRCQGQPRRCQSAAGRMPEACLTHGRNFGRNGCQFYGNPEFPPTCYVYGQQSTGTVCSFRGLILRSL